MSFIPAPVSDTERADYQDTILAARTTDDLRNIVDTIRKQNAEQRRLIEGGQPNAAPGRAASEGEFR